MHTSTLQLGHPYFVKKDFEKIWRRCHKGARIVSEVADSSKKHAGGGADRGVEHAKSVHEVSLEDFAPLPAKNIKERQIMMKTLVAAQKKRALACMGTLRHLFLSSVSQRIFQHAFWLTFLVSFYYKAEGVRRRVRDQLTTLFAQLVVEAEAPRGEAMHHYPFFLAESIFNSFQEAFPSSTALFDDGFVIHVYRVVSLELNGFTWNPITIQEFRQQYFTGTSKLPDAVFKPRHQADPTLGGKVKREEDDGSHGEHIDRIANTSSAFFASTLISLRPGEGKSISTTMLSPVLQRRCEMKSLFTMRDPGLQISFVDPSLKGSQHLRKGTVDRQTGFVASSSEEKAALPSAGSPTSLSSGAASPAAASQPMLNLGNSAINPTQGADVEEKKKEVRKQVREGVRARRDSWTTSKDLSLVQSHSKLLGEPARYVLAETRKIERRRHSGNH